MSVHIGIERSDLRMSGSSSFCTDWLVEAPPGLWYTIETRNFSFISLWPHIPFDDWQGCWWTRNLLFLTPFAHPVTFSAGFTGIALLFQFKFSRQWSSTVSHTEEMFSFLCCLTSAWPSLVQVIIGIVRRSPGSQPWPNTHREWDWAGSELSTWPLWLTDSLLL